MHVCFYNYAIQWNVGYILRAKSYLFDWKQELNYWTVLWWKWQKTDTFISTEWNFYGFCGNCVWSLSIFRQVVASVCTIPGIHWCANLIESTYAGRLCFHAVSVSVSLSTCLPVRVINFECFDIETSFLVWWYILPISRSRLSIKVIGLRSRSLW